MECSREHPVHRRGWRELRWEKEELKPCLGAGLKGAAPQGLPGSRPVLLWLPVRAMEEPWGLCCQRLREITPILEGPEKDRSHKRLCPLLQEGTPLFLSLCEPPPLLSSRESHTLRGVGRAQELPVGENQPSEGVQAHPLHFGEAAPIMGRRPPARSPCGKFCSGRQSLTETRPELHPHAPLGMWKRLLTWSLTPGRTGGYTDKEPCLHVTIRKGPRGGVGRAAGTSGKDGSEEAWDAGLA